MAIAVDSTTTDSENTAGASPTLTYSTACDVDDILLVAVAVNVSGSTATIGAPSTTSGSTSAWTEVAKINPNNGCGVGVWWAKVTGAGTINVSQTTTRSGNNVGARGVMLEISGANTSTPIGSTDTHDASSDCLASNSNLEIAGENGNLVFLVGGNWNASGNNTEDIDSGSDSGYTAIWTGTTRYESGQCDYHAGRTILSANDTTTRGVLDQVTGTGDWVAAIVEVAVAAGGSEVTGTIATNLGALGSSVSGVPTTFGTVAQSFGALASTVVGAPVEPGVAAGVFGALAATAAGVPSTFGAVATGLGALGSTVAGVPTTFGAVASDLGSLVGVALGPNLSGVVSTNLGALAAVASGARTITGTVSTVFGGGGEVAAVLAGATLAANRTTYRTSGPLAHQL